MPALPQRIFLSGVLLGVIRLSGVLLGVIRSLVLNRTGGEFQVPFLSFFLGWRTPNLIMLRHWTK
jgi:hypothetical protein